MIKKSWIFLFVFVLVVSLFSVGVFAYSPLEREPGVSYSEQEKCMAGCKADFADEESRSPCIIKCKEDYPIDFEKGEDDLRCLQCGDSCAPYDFVVSAMCQKPTQKLKCGVKDGECVSFGVDEEDFIDKRDGDCGDFDCDEIELEIGAGTTPDSAFYFIDEFFDRFGDKIEIREEKIAEIKKMVEEGKIEAAHEALKNYIEQAEELEKEVNPEESDETLRSAAAIRNTLKKLEDSIPEDDREDFVNNVIKREGDITTAADIANKIKDLCEQLSELDPVKYGEVCSSGDDSPKWQRKLDRKLTKEQKEEAKKFGKIMEQCFKTSGQECACEDISFYDFSVACSKAAPLATACDIKGDEKACDELENLDMPRLPDYLEDVFGEIEERYGESKYDMHMPKECVEAGAETPKDCGKIMIKTHAPLECRAALLEAEVSSEKEGREICEKIMFEKHAPQECIDKGITSPDECGKFMDSFRGEDRRGDFNPGRDCMKIEDSSERLKCFENAANNAGEHYGTDPKFEGEGELTWQCKENRIHWPPDCEKFMREEWPELEKQQAEEGEKRRMEEGDWRVKEKECAASCDLENGWWDFRGGECVCYTDERSGEPKPGEWDGASCDDCASECESRAGQRLRATDCVNGRCECYYESDEPDYGPGEGPDDCESGDCAPPGGIEGGDDGNTEIYTGPENTQEPESVDSGNDYSGSSDSVSSDSGGSSGGGSDGGSDSGDSGGSDGGGSDSGSSDSGSSGGDSGGSNDGGDAGITGGAISNRFLDYYFG